MTVSGRWRAAAVALMAALPALDLRAAWPVEEATIRFDVEVVEQPSEPTAGVLVILPDGGLLPGPVPVPVVLSDAGRTLPSQVVWQNKARGLGVVFASPPSKRATVFVRGGAAVPALLPGADLHPSLLLYTREGRPSLDAAEKLGAALPWETDSVLGTVPVIGQRENPFGQDEAYVSYYSGWFRRARPGRVYFCTVSDDGSELRVDGTTVASWPGIHSRADGAQGQYGRWMELDAGLHRIEYFYFQDGGDQEAQAAWKIRGESSKELPVMIPASAFLHSGRAMARGAAYRDGRPVIAITGNTMPASYFWFQNRPVGLFRFSCDLADGNSSDTSYSWTMGADWSVSGRGLAWLIEGCASARPVTLTASNRCGATAVSAPIECWDAPRRAQVWSEQDVNRFREALLGMCRAVPGDKDPCARWSPDLWATLENVCEPFSGQEVLAEVFDRGRKSVLLLPRKERWCLQEVFVGCLRGRDAAAAARWIGKFEAEEADPQRRFYWKNEAFDVALYSEGNSAAARALAAAMKNLAGSDEEKLVSEIRLADVERMAGNRDEAIRLYSDAQDRYHEKMRAGTAAAKFAATSADPWTRGARKREARGNVPSAVAQSPGRDWKVAAMRQAAFYSTVSALVKEGRFFESRDKLRQWELEFPLGKLSGEYSLAEAEYYMAIFDYKRALATVQLYRRGVELSDSLPAIMGLELKCLTQMNRHGEAADLARTILKRFPNHSVAEQARPLAGGGK